MNNPSSWPSRIWVAVIASIATLISLYLALYQWQVITTVWDPFFGDGTVKVLTSDLSHMFTEWIHMPDAFLGVLAYGSDVLLALVGSTNRWRELPWLVLIFGISVIPLGFVSGMLVLLQGAVVHYWCFLCLVSAAISFILIFFAYPEVAATCRALHQIKGFRNRLRATFKGLDSRE